MAEPRNVDQRIEERRIVVFSPPPPPSIIHPAVTRGLRQKSIFLCLPFDCSASFWKRKEEKKGRLVRQISRLFSSLPPPSLALSLGMVRWRQSRKDEAKIRFLFRPRPSSHAFRCEEPHVTAAPA